MVLVQISGAHHHLPMVEQEKGQPETHLVLLNFRLRSTTSHTFNALSSPADTMNLPSPLMAMYRTSSDGFEVVASALSAFERTDEVAVSNTCSDDPEARTNDEGEDAIAMGG
jgi:hypothetical protein